MPATMEFELPPEFAAGEPPEARGLPRDGVRMMVSHVSDDRVRHATFRDLPRLLEPGDLLVVNASATINASLAGRWESGQRAGDEVELHLSTPLPGGTPEQWVIELREPTDEGTVPLLTARAGDRLRVGPAGYAVLREAYAPGLRPSTAGPHVRLWVAELGWPDGTLAYAARHGSPIRYRYVRDPWPLEAYQAVFSSEPGSAEMPSAGRPFTRAVLARLERAGIGVAPLLLHTGVGSLEAGEAPYPERYRVSRTTAAAINAVYDAGRRVVAVGTTVVRGLETVHSAAGRVVAGAGWTDLAVTPERGVRSVGGILTGLHEPGGSHLAMLEAFAGRAHLEKTYRAALEERYLWHEFGDVHLMLG
jgi:S-adenosylmethionine:tRNA ribosyltransferase-isomerase